jgi:flavin-dependent dehydrogenase
MSKTPQPQPDVLVIGDHPCAYFAAALLRQNASIRVVHTRIPGEELLDRLVAINPELFDLHELLTPLKRKLDLVPIYGLKFLADDPNTEIAHVGKTISAYIASFKQIHQALIKLAEEKEVRSYDPDTLEIRQLDEGGVDITINKAHVHAKILILAGELPANQKQMLGLPPAWDGEVLHRYTYLRLKGSKWYDAGSKAVMPMSLDLNGTLNWAWLMPGNHQVQLAVEQPVDGSSALSSTDLLGRWIDVLIAHGVLNLPPGSPPIDVRTATSLELPLAGALSQEGVANRTLLIGPAGGFYTACAEDIYPTLWSALHAADVAKKALKERHVQDALQPYRQKWGSTLGDYLRGPQQNLRFLLPLVYRNAIMTARLTEAILSGKSVVR